MHDSSERRPASGRPSLLSTDQAPAQQDHSILRQLDGRTTPARGSTAPVQRDHGRVARAVLLVVGIASIGTMAWLALGSVSQSPDASMAAVHAPVPVRPVPAAPAAVPVVAPSSAIPEAPKAALIQDDLSAALDAPARPATGGAHGPSEALAVAPPALAKAAKTGKDDLASLLDAPATAPVPVSKPVKPDVVDGAAPRKERVAKKPATDKLARADKPRSPASPAKPKPPAKPAPKKAAPPVDTDVALLAALLAHTKTPVAGSAEDIFKRCATNATAAEVQRCRVRVCQGSAKGAAECKSVRITKISS